MMKSSQGMTPRKHHMQHLHEINVAKRWSGKRLATLGASLRSLGLAALMFSKAMLSKVMLNKVMLT